ncbi:GNAT family N-acetyltransferase [Dictyobacter vulcani]|uniref:GNAT family N-acetyltransferase n=1 Tax=Dictyobacter vulcani TaxID=2607529 RepID=A0A5J4KFV5_9CHLR|nr:GNAT family N-acetyltransferase [Dictyobacter vulcani]GER88398.1 GNAT family N-acetyltransferase [Dictyobacter vulcani]
MPDEQVQGLVKKLILTPEDQQHIKQLAVLCERHEQLHMRIEWNLLARRSGAIVSDYLYYADGMLVGYLLLDNQGASQSELVGMVHPDYRRQGIFRHMLAEAAQQHRAQGSRALILTCEHKSLSGQAFLRALDARLSESEHEMFLVHHPPHPAFDERLLVERADSSDIEALALVQAESFQDPLDITRQRIQNCLQAPDRIYYLAMFGDSELGCREPVGSFRLDIGGEFDGIYAFGVRPAYQGRGYGRQILMEAITILHARSQKSILIEVDIENSRAIHLYKSCGFVIRTTYDYYVLELDVFGR